MDQTDHRAAVKEPVAVMDRLREVVKVAVVVKDRLREAVKEPIVAKDLLREAVKVPVAVKDLRAVGLWAHQTRNALSKTRCDLMRTQTESSTKRS